MGKHVKTVNIMIKSWQRGSIKEENIMRLQTFGRGADLKGEWTLRMDAKFGKVCQSREDKKPF